MYSAHTFREILNHNCKQEKTSNVKNDPISPNHYKGRYGLEAIDIYRNFFTDEEFSGAMKNNCLKYLLRAGKKKSSKKIEDLQKARVYLNWWIDAEEKQVNQQTNND